MKVINNISSITDNSGAFPITTYSNAVQTIVQTPEDFGGRDCCPITCVCRCVCCCYRNRCCGCRCCGCRGCANANCR